MNRAEFMRQLETLLQSIPVMEREEALQYYNDYFDDAGSENEQKVIEALGNPARVAENIRRDLLESGYGEAPPKKVSAADRQMIEYGKAETPPPQPRYDLEVLPKESQRAAEGAGEKRTAQSGQPGQSGKSGWIVAMLILLGVFGSPVWGSLLGALLTVIGTWFGLIFGFGLAAVLLLVMAVVLLVLGVQCLVVDPLAGVALMGTGMLVGSIAILCLMATVALAGIVTPAICRGIVGLFRKRPKRNRNVRTA